jgi:Glycosyl hydrolases family 2, sugar binding domain
MGSSVLFLQRARKAILAAVPPVLLAVTPRLAAATPLADAGLPAGVTLNWDKTSVTTVNAKRARVSLNGIWRFSPAAEGSAEPPKLGWGYVKVPGNWQSSRRRSAALFAPGGGPQWDHYDGKRVARAWYERRVSIPAEWQGRAISLRFDRVCTDAIVYVNGAECGRIAWPWVECWWRPLPMRNRWERSGRTPS